MSKKVFRGPPTPSRRVPLLAAVNLHKTYRRHAIEVPVLTGLDLEVYSGEFLSVVGVSGSGKSTLLHLLGTLDHPDEGTIHLNGERIDHLPSERRDRLRNGTFGFIFQFYHLLPELTTLENVLMPHMIAHSWFSWMRYRRSLRQHASELLERVGLGHRLHHKPRELSGGEMQRAAIARALVSRPQVLLADEPTGNLDVDQGMEIVKLLRALNAQDRLTIIMVTHNMEIVAATDRVVRLVKGRVEKASEGPELTGQTPPGNGSGVPMPIEQADDEPGPPISCIPQEGEYHSSGFPSSQGGLTGGPSLTLNEGRASKS